MMRLLPLFAVVDFDVVVIVDDGGGCFSQIRFRKVEHMGM
jgi:hypothetical protein